MRVAILTPWPDQPTGIADYSYDLVGGLVRQGMKVSVFTDCRNDDHLRPAPPGVPLCDQRAFDRVAHRFDEIVFQLGNNPYFHSWMIPLIQRYEGVIHLHDLALQHLFGGLTFAKGDTGGYLNLIGRWYGETVRSDVAQLLALRAYPWQLRIVMDLPLFEEVVQYACACVVHSGFAATRVSGAFPDLPMFTVSQLYDLPPRTPQPSDPILRIGVFGGVARNRHVDQVIWAVAAACASARRSTELHIVGDTAPDCVDLLGKAINAAANRQLQVVTHGRVSGDDFHHLMQSCGLVVSMRFPTMGETSAVVVKAMQYGIPCIVTDIGWYAELPDLVHKVRHDHMADDLIVEIQRWVENDTQRAQWAEECLDYAAKFLDFDAAVRRYSEFLGAIKWCHDPFIKPLAETMCSIGLVNPENHLLASISGKFN